MSDPRLSVVLVVGRMRRRAERSLRAILEQEVEDGLEVLLVDTSPEVPRISGASSPEVTYLEYPDCPSFAHAKLRGLARVSGARVAFVEDHAFVEVGWAAGVLETIHGEDPGLCVIDEVAGMQVTFLGLAAGPLGWLAGFFWFRIFDILKPFGVRRLERLGGGGGVGIMADDLGAGVLAAIATQVTVRVLGWQA